MNRAVASVNRGLGSTVGARVRELNGYDERSIPETQGLPPLVRMIALLERVVVLDSGRGAKDALQELPIGDAIGLMLLLRKRTLGENLDCELSCPGCGEEVSVILSVDTLLNHERPSMTSNRKVELRGFLLKLRPVLVRDIASLWAASNGPARVEGLVHSCVLESEPPLPEKLGNDLISEIALKMEELDARAETIIQISCPACANLFRVPFAPEDFFFQEMDSRCTQLEREVHFLALNYHWSEKAILSLPTRRRKLHVELIGTSLSEGEG